MRQQRFWLFIAAVFIFGQAGAQRYMGVATGSYSSLNSLYLNPANISGSHEKIEVNISSVNIAVDNSSGTFSKIGDLGNDNTDAFTLTGNQPFSMLIPTIEMRLPGVMVSLNDEHKQSFALTTRVRGINQFNNFDPSLYNTIVSNDHTSNQTYRLQSSNFNWTAHVWSEIGLSYAIQAFESGPHKLKAGITLRYLGGADYLSLKGKYLDASYTSGSDTLFANHSDLEFSSNAIGSKDVKSNGVQSSDVFGSLFGARGGSGFGMDIGVSYTYNIAASDKLGSKDDPENDDGHMITISAAITDIGSIKYKEKNNFFVNVTGNGYLTGKGLSDNIDNYSKFRNYVVAQGFTADTGSKTTTLRMPTAFVMGADCQVYRRVSVNMTYVANLVNRQDYGNSYYNQFTITPRYDYRLLCVALPITYSSLGHDMKLGFAFRITGFFIGSDDMLALVSSKMHGFGFYMGGFVPIFKNKGKGLFK